MAQFVLFMRGSAAGFAKMTPEQIQQVIQKYESWARQLVGQGKLRGGEKLQDDGGRAVRLQNGKLVIDGPFPETKETIGGYYVVESKDYDEAIEIAKGCPIFSSGGTVEVRQVEPQH